MIQKISIEEANSRLQLDLQRYMQLALKNGASAAEVINTSQIIFDERVRMKCQFPLCEHFGTSMNCPPHTGKVEEMAARAKLYNFAVVFNVLFPSERVVSGGGNPKENIEDRRLISRIVSTIESEAFYDGHYFATGFGAGPCKHTWCGDLPCQALQGGGCRKQAIARASMEGVGIDVYRLATSLGWDIYPIGRSVRADTVPYGTRLGLVLIA